MVKRTRPPSDPILQCIDALRPLLPVNFVISDGLDRVTVVRLVCTILRLNAFKRSTIPLQIRQRPELTDYSQLALMALDGFCILLDGDNYILYATEGVSTQLGFAQAQIMGQHVSTLLHSDDLCQFTAVPQLTHSPCSGIFESSAAFTIRFKTCLARRLQGFAHNAHKTATCQVVFYDSVNYGVCRRRQTLIIAQLIDNKMGSPEVLLNPDMFVMVCSPSLKVLFLESHGSNLLFTDAKYIIDHSLYELIHPNDAGYVENAHSRVTHSGDGQSTTPCILFIGTGTLARACLVPKAPFVVAFGLLIAKTVGLEYRFTSSYSPFIEYCTSWAGQKEPVSVKDVGFRSSSVTEMARQSLKARKRQGSMPSIPPIKRLFSYTT